MVLHVANLSLVTLAQGEIVGLVILAIVGWLLYRTGAKSKALGEAGSGPH